MGSLLVMVQREVGERLAAGAGDEAYGVVSVKVAYWATARWWGRCRPACSSPVPASSRSWCASTAIRADRGPPATAGWARRAEYERLFAVVRGGFAHRRKMLRRALLDLVDPEAFVAAGVDPTARAEELGLEAWERLAWWRPGVALAS